MHTLFWSKMTYKYRDQSSMLIQTKTEPLHKTNKYLPNILN